MIIRTPAGRYRVRVKHRSRVVADRTFDRRTDARQWEAEQKRQLQLGDWIDPRAGEVTVAELAEEWLPRRFNDVAQRTAESDESAARVHIVPALGRRPVGSLTKADVQRFVQSLAVERKEGTVRRVTASLASLLQYAVDQRRIRASPAVAVRIPKPDHAPAAVRMRPFTRPDLLDLVASHRTRSQHYGDLTLLLGLTGLRFSEVTALRVADMTELPYPSLRVSRATPRSRGGGRVIERPTTKSRRSRTVPLTPEVAAMLRRRAGNRDPIELLFPSPRGQYLSLQNYRRSVAWSSTAAGHRVHDLRHTAATLWLSAGLDVKVVQTWLGHASATLTLDLYGHYLGTDADRAALARLAAAWSAPPSGTATGPQNIRSVDQDGGKSPRNSA